MIFKISFTLNIILLGIVIILAYNLQLKKANVKQEFLECRVTQLSSDNTILKANYTELERLRQVELNQYKDYMRINDDIVKKQKQIVSDLNNIDVINKRLLDTEKQARNKAFDAYKNATERDNETLRRYATIQEELHQDCRGSLIEVAEDATRLQQKLKEFDEKWDILESYSSNK